VVDFLADEFPELWVAMLPCLVAWGMCAPFLAFAIVFKLE